MSNFIVITIFIKSKNQKRYTYYDPTPKKFFKTCKVGSKPTRRKLLYITIILHRFPFVFMYIIYK